MAFDFQGFKFSWLASDENCENHKKIVIFENSLPYIESSAVKRGHDLCSLIDYSFEIIN